MVSKAASNVALRPIRSPKCPKSAAPIGRAIKAIAKVAKDCNGCGGRIRTCREEQMRKNNHCRCCINIKIEEFDRRTYKTRS